MPSSPSTSTTVSRPSVRTFREADREPFLALHASAWRRIYGERYPVLLDFQDELIAARNLVVAEVDARVVGYGQFFQFGQKPKMGGLVALRARTAAGERAARMQLRLQLTRRALRYRLFRRPVVRRLSRAPVPLPGRLDAYMLDLVVDPAHRRRRLGTRLTEKRLEMAAEQGARHAYVNCKEASHSNRIYDALGFTPFLYERPYTPNGAGSTYMYREI